MHEFFKVNSDVDHKVVADHNLYREILEIDLKLTDALHQRDAERACFFGRERDLLIDTIVAQEPSLLSKPCKLQLLVTG